MKNIDHTVLKETKYIAAVTAILSILMQVVFLVLRLWDISVLSGNLLGALFAVLNFFLMGLTVQNALTKDEKGAKSLVKFSQSGRLFMLLIVALIGNFVSVFNLFAVIIPFIFPRIAVTLRPLIIKDKSGKE